MSVSLPDIALATCLLLITVTRLIFSRHSTPTADLSAQSPSQPSRTRAEELLLYQRPMITSDGWRSMTIFDLATAEDLLDEADAAGYAERTLIVLGNSTFVVRWR
jgi:hypothetical protein